MPSPMVEKIRNVVTGPIDGLGYELVDLEWKREAGGWVCRLFVDNPNGVTSIDDCERVSRQVSAVLDVADIIPQAYNLEVSSPGLDRPLRTAAHFRKFVGQRAKVRLVNGVDNRRNFTGTILAVSGDGAAATVSVQVDDGQRFTLPLADLDKANLVYDFSKDLARGSLDDGQTDEELDLAGEAGGDDAGATSTREATEAGAEAEGTER